MTKTVFWTTAPAFLENIPFSLRLTILLGWIMGAAVLLAQVSFLVGGTGWWTPGLALISICSGWLALVKRGYREVAAILLILAVAILLAGKTYDYSWDGMWYHKNAIIALSDGWSPLYEKHWELWGSVYPVGAWVWGSFFYHLFGHLQYAHALNFFLALLSPILIYGLIDCFDLPNKIRSLISVLIAANPVVIAQLSTGYVDGTMGIGLVFLFLLGLNFWRTKRSLLLGGMIGWSLFVASIKFTGVTYVVSFAAVLVGLAVYFWRIKIPQLSVKVFKAATLIGLGACLVNIHPLITNFQGHGHPLWPLFGKDRWDIMAWNAAPQFLALGPVKREFVSLFVETSNSLVEYPAMKLPGKIHKSEWRSLFIDTRYAGFGPAFSLGLVLGLVGFGGVLFQRKNGESSGPVASYLGVYLLLILWGYACVHPWWARYAPQWWLLPILPALFLWRSARSINQTILGLGLVVVFANSLGAMTMAYRAATLAYKNEYRPFIDFVKDCSPTGEVYLTSIQKHIPLKKSHARMLQDLGYEVWSEEVPMPQKINELEKHPYRDYFTAYCRQYSVN